MQRGEVDRRRRLNGLHAADQGALDVDPIAVIVEAFVRPDPTDDLHRLADAREGPIEGDAVEALDRAGPARAEADHHASAGELVDGAEVHRERGGCAGEDVDDRGGQADAAGFAGEQRQAGEGVVAVALDHGDGVDPDLVGEAGAIEEGLDNVGVPREVDGESGHWGFSAVVVGGWGGWRRGSA